MKIEDQVVSLEIAKKLKALGCKQESLFYWKRLVDGWGDAPSNELVQKRGVDNEKIVNGKEIHYSEKYFSAFTVAELGEMLPDLVFSSKDEEKWLCDYSLPDDDKEDWNELHFEADTEANARGLMLIYLLEHGLLKHN